MSRTVPASQGDWLARVEAASVELSAAEAAVVAARARRDGVLQEAAEAGCERTALAVAAGLSRKQVYNIV